MLRTLSIGDFYQPWGAIRNHKWIASNIRRFNSFPIRPYLNSHPSDKLGRWRRWDLNYGNGDTGVRICDDAPYKAKTKGTFFEAVVTHYSDGLAWDHIMWDLMAEEMIAATCQPVQRSPMTCLARAHRLFPAPVMPLEMLDVLAKVNIGITSETKFQGEGAHLQLPSPGQFLSSWVQPIPTRLFPRFGQPALFFHSHKLFVILNTHQDRMIEELWTINQKAYEKNGEYLWDPDVLMQSKRLAEEFPANARTLSAALRLLLRHVDPDMFTFLLYSIDDRMALASEVDQWVHFVRLTLQKYLPDQNGPDGEYVYLAKFRANSRVIRGDTAPTIGELSQIQLRQREAGIGRRPLIRTWLSKKLNEEHIDVLTALDKFVEETQRKIIRHALETARSLLEDGKTPEPIAAVTLEELGTYFDTFCNDLRSRPNRIGPKARAEKARAGARAKAKAEAKAGAEEKAKAKKKRTSLHSLLPSLEAFERRLPPITTTEVAELSALRSALRQVINTLEKGENLSSRTEDSKVHDSFITELREHRAALKNAAARYLALHGTSIEDKSTTVSIFQEFQDKYGTSEPASDTHGYPEDEEEPEYQEGSEDQEDTEDED